MEFPCGGLLACRKCGITLSSKAKNVRKHYRKVHGEDYAPPPNQLPKKRSHDKEKVNPPAAKKGKLDVEIKQKEDPIINPAPEIQLRPVTEMFGALQSTFDLLRPQTQRDVMKTLTSVVIDAFYKDQLSEGGRNPDKGL